MSTPGSSRSASRVRKARVEMGLNVNLLAEALRYELGSVDAQLNGLIDVKPATLDAALKMLAQYRAYRKHILDEAGRRETLALVELAELLHTTPWNLAKLAQRETIVPVGKRPKQLRGIGARRVPESFYTAEQVHELFKYNETKLTHTDDGRCKGPLAHCFLEWWASQETGKQVAV